MKATRRLVIAVGKRVAVEDPDDLHHLLALDAALQTAFEIAVAGLRETGYSDGQIGEALGGITKQSVRERFPRRNG